MKRHYVLVNSGSADAEGTRETCREMLGLLDDGYVFDPLVGKPIVAEDAVHFLLVKYESEEEKPKTLGEFADVASLKEVPNAEVDTYLAQGYEIQAIYSKNSVLVKRK